MSRTTCGRNRAGEGCRGTNSFWFDTRADPNRFIDCPVRFHASRLKNVFLSEWRCSHEIVSVKADPLKVEGRVPGCVAM